MSDRTILYRTPKTLRDQYRASTGQSGLEAPPPGVTQQKLRGSGGSTHTQTERHHDMSQCTRDTQPHTSHTLTEKPNKFEEHTLLGPLVVRRTTCPSPPRANPSFPGRKHRPTRKRLRNTRRRMQTYLARSPSETAEGPSTRRGNCRPIGRRLPWTWLSPSRSWERCLWGRPTAPLPKKSQTQTCRGTRASAKAKPEELCEKQLPSGRRPPSEPSTLPWRAHR